VFCNQLQVVAMHTTIIGRSSSHFTRIVRIFAAELGVPYTFDVVRDLSSSDFAVYAGNPALKIPVLRNDHGTWYGALPICRELQRQSNAALRILWPEQVTDNVSSNAQELIFHALATGVNLIMAKASGNGAPLHPKNDISLDNSLTWLNSHVSQIGKDLPERDLSFLEVSLFCLIQHLEFRTIRHTESYANLREFCARFGQRASALATPFQFDAQ